MLRRRLILPETNDQKTVIFLDNRTLRNPAFRDLSLSHQVMINSIAEGAPLFAQQLLKLGKRRTGHIIKT